MNHRILAVSAVAVFCALAVCLSLQSQRASAQTNTSTSSVTPYNPYPPGILPPDLNSEIARVLREVDSIEAEALAESNALPPIMFTGQPPTIQGSGYVAVRTLGKLLNYDKHMSTFKNEACASCHMPYAGFSGPIPTVNLLEIAYPGSYHFRSGKRTAQRYT